MYYSLNFTTRNSIKQYFIYAERIREGFQKFKKQMVLILAITTILTIIIILLLPMKGIKDVIIYNNVDCWKEK